MIKHLETATEGAIVKGPSPSTTECEACSLSKSKQIISRRPPEHPATVPFERVYFDVVHQIEGYNNHNYMLHLFDEVTKFHEVETTVHIGDGITLDILQGWYNLHYDRYGCKWKYIRLDGERTLQVQFETWCRTRNPPIIIERTPPYIKEPRAGAERSGGVIDDMGRTLRINGNLPENMWPEAVKSAKDFLNILPTKALNWRTPYEVLMIF